jgi:hypothetical protein
LALNRLALSTLRPPGGGQFGICLSQLDPQGSGLLALFSQRRAQPFALGLAFLKLLLQGLDFIGLAIATKEPHVCTLSELLG